eukprot:CAMPEP_0174362468 /NCGR_PEP_ID=MMETSP0811_2-20130205/64455_1 /TAXON_ID=73025 ORGANISM="Eutreptiella gymnastica-like, Strain CCMP1594" /NCGR_SAMPLE_ID=MMETSP0811_2 /ASSEMBLY_ACC=CAM_ASM_000667 /LENGTH=69 /DNA_ID=CAMNT_0015500169 /DNA_START=43 /DNA_END=248 /DNA_ORIENTATION=+
MEWKPHHASNGLADLHKGFAVVRLGSKFFVSGALSASVQSKDKSSLEVLEIDTKTDSILRVEASGSQPP